MQTTASRKVINGWAMYDWANSVYSLVITTTFFPIYFTASTRSAFGGDEVSFLGGKFINSALYNYALSAAYLITALLYPILTSIADSRGNKKSFMRFFCYLGAAGCSLLYFFKGENIHAGILFFMMASIGFCGSLVFYNSYLPEIAAIQDRDRVSARGFSFGYAGSVIMQIAGFILVMTLPDAGEASRITFLLVGIWWAGFAQISFVRLPDNNRIASGTKGNIWKDGFSEMKKVYRQVTGLPVLKRFLRSFFFYSMGVQTVMLAATLFGSKVLGLDDTKLIITVVVIQLVAIAGAWSIARLSEKFGNFNVLISLVLIWIGICVLAYYTAVLKEEGHNPENMFYLLATAVGLVMGGIQSLSRSTYAKLMPDTTDNASFFSYFDLTEKMAIVIGTFTFGLIEELTRDHGGMKNSVLSLIVFFIAGFIWLLMAKSKQVKIREVSGRSTR